MRIGDKESFEEKKVADRRVFIECGKKQAGDQQVAQALVALAPTGSVERWTPSFS